MSLVATDWNAQQYIIRFAFFLVSGISCFPQICPTFRSRLLSNLSNIYHLKTKRDIIVKFQLIHLNIPQRDSQVMNNQNVEAKKKKEMPLIHSSLWKHCLHLSPLSIYHCINEKIYIFKNNICLKWFLFENDKIRGFSPLRTRTNGIKNLCKTLRKWR